MRGIKIMTVIILTVVSHNLFSQCNTDKLSRRTYINYVQGKEKVIGIRLIAQLNYQSLLNLSKQSDTMFEYIGEQMKYGLKPYLEPIISKIQAQKKEMEIRKQSKETVKIDMLTYCFLNFSIEVWQGIQIIFKNGNIKSIKKKLDDYSNKIRYEENQRIIEIDREMDYLKQKYPINNN